VTIFGIVVRQITGAEPQEPYEVEDKSYYDPASAIATETALLRAPPHVAAVLGLPLCGHDSNKLASCRGAIAKQVEQADMVNAPGTIVLPIPIYI